MSNLFWQKGNSLLAATETPFRSEEELEMRLFNTRGILQDINIISRQIKARTVSGVKIPDMIGVDAEGNVVIIENKNVTVDEKIIAQVLEYAIWAETNPDSLKNIWLEAAPEGVEPDWDNLQIRIIVVAPEIKKHLVRFVGKIGYQTDLFELKRYVIDNNEFLLVNQLEPERLVSKTVHTTQEWGFDYYRTEHNRESVKQMEKVVALVDSFVKKNGWELEKKFNKHYVGYKYGFPNVMGVNWLGSRSFGLYFKLPDEPKSVPKNIKGLEYRQYSDRWKQLEYKVTAANFDINKIKPLVEAAYKNIKGSRTHIIMTISDEHLDQFIELYQKHYGETLDRDVAYEKAFRLLRLIEIVEKRDNLDQSD